MPALRLVVRMAAAALVAPVLAACDNPFPHTAPYLPAPEPSTAIPLQQQTAKVSLPVTTSRSSAAELLAPAVSQVGDAKHAHVTITPHEVPLSSGTLKRTNAALASLGIPPGNVTVAAPAAGALHSFDVVITRVEAGTPDCDAMLRPSDTSYAEQRARFAFGCATMTNLSRMIDDPQDLVHPAPYKPVDTTPRTTAVDRYEADKTYAVKETQTSTSAGGK